MNCPGDWLKEACRSKEKGEKAAAEIVRTSNNPAVRWKILIYWCKTAFYINNICARSQYWICKNEKFRSHIYWSWLWTLKPCCFAKCHATGFGITSLSTRICCWIFGHRFSITCTGKEIASLNGNDMCGKRLYVWDIYSHYETQI